MRIDRLTHICVALFVGVLGVANAVGAQGHEMRAAVEYQWLRLSGTTMGGVNGELSLVIRTPLVLIADAGWARQQTEATELSVTSHIVTFGGGLRLMPGRSRVRPFVQIVAGGENLGVRGTLGAVTGRGSKTWLQLEPGAGFHVHVGPRVAIATSLHVRRVFLEEAVFEVPSDTRFRALAGVSVQLRK
jgi:hypothetical protein